MTKSRLRTTLWSAFAAALLAASLGLWSTTSSAAEADPDSTAQTGEDTEGTEKEDTEVTGSGPSSEVFIPTEEISEDFAVSFPVDI